MDFLIIVKKLIFPPVHDGSMINKPEEFILRYQGSVERISIRNELNLGKQLLIKGGR